MKNLKIKLILALALFFLFAPSVFASTCGVLPAGGNWNAAGTWHSCAGSIPAAGDDVIATSSAGNLVVNATTNALKSFDLTGYAGTLSGTSQISVRGLTASTQNVIFDGTITWTGILSLQPTTATANLNLTTNGKLLNRITTSTSAATITLQDNLSFQAVKTASLTLGVATIDMNGKTISGSSETNRLLIQSDTIGTQRTLIINSGTFAYADFMDINLSTNTDLSAITGLSGNAGGNSNITFTSATTTYWIGNSGNTDDTAEWSWGSGLAGSTSRVPLPQDICVFDANSFSGTGFTVTNTQQRICTGMDFSAVGTDNPTFTFANTGGFTLSTYGSFIMDSGMTMSNISGATLDFRSRTSGKTIDMQGVSIPRPVTINAFGGTYTLVNDFTTTSTVTSNSGTLDADIYSLTCTVFTMANTTNAIINMGSGTWTVTGTGSAWNIGTNAVINAETSTIVVSNTTATAKTFVGASKTYNNVTFTGQNITISGSNTFNTLTLNTAGLAIGTKFTTGTTQTMAGFSANGSAGSLVYASSTSATNATLTKTGGGTICEDYLSITDLTGSPASTWYAGTNSTDGGDNTNWTFSACPASTPVFRSTKTTLMQRFKMVLMGKKMIIR